MAIIAVLVSGPKKFIGSGLNHDGETFTGELFVQPLLEGRAVMLHYEATVDDGMQVHAECALLAHEMDGTLALWTVMSELPGVLHHKAVRASDTEVVFASGPRSDRDRFREELAIKLVPDGALIYAHAWGLPDGDFEDRSSCRMVPSDA